MITICPNCGSPLSIEKDGMKKLAQGCKHCQNCGGTYFIIETSIPKKEIKKKK